MQIGDDQDVLGLPRNHRRDSLVLIRRDARIVCQWSGHGSSPTGAALRSRVRALRLNAKPIAANPPANRAEELTKYVKNGLVTSRTAPSCPGDRYCDVVPSQ